MCNHWNRLDKNQTGFDSHMQNIYIVKFRVLKKDRIKIGDVKEIYKTNFYPFIFTQSIIKRGDILIYIIINVENHSISLVKNSLILAR